MAKRDFNFKEIVDYIDNVPHWFQLDSEEGSSEILFATREHGDVGAEEAGEADIEMAYTLKKMVEAEFNCIAEVEEVDEWTHLIITSK